MKFRHLAATAAGLLALAGCGSSHQAPPVHPTPAQAAHAAQTRVPSEHLAHPQLNATPQPGLAAPRPLSGVSTLPGQDAVTITNIPLGEPVVGCYVTGRYANCSAAQARFPNSHIVTIATYAAVPSKAECLDIEPTDAIPAEASQFYRHEVSLGVQKPCFYAAASLTGYEMWRVQNDLTFAGIDRSKYLEWVANWNGNPLLTVGTDAHQWASDPRVDHDTFGAWFFAPVKPPVPLCARTMCYFKFSTSRYTNPKLGPCHHGCDERSYMYAWQHDVHKSHAKRLSDRYRLQALQRHREYQITHGHNTRAYRQVAHVLWAAGFEAAWRSNFDKYVEVKG